MCHTWIQMSFCISDSVSGGPVTEGETEARRGNAPRWESSCVQGVQDQALSGRSRSLGLSKSGELPLASEHRHSREHTAHEHSACTRGILFTYMCLDGCAARVCMWCMCVSTWRCPDVHTSA